MTARKIALFLSLALLVALSTTLLHAQSNEGEQRAAAAQGGGILDTLERLKEAQAQQQEGSWDIIVTPVVPPGVPPIPPIHAYGTFARGGTYIGSDRTRPASKQHGVWEHLGGNMFAHTAKEDLFDPQGGFAGILTIRLSTTLIGKDEFVGVAQGEQRDVNGNLVFAGCTTVRGTRIKIEPLAEQCRSITPPQ